MKFRVDPMGQKKAQRKLAEAERALVDFRDAEELSGALSAWEDFVTKWWGVYSALEQAVKVDTKSNSWFGRVKSEIRKSEILQYLKQCRDADQHGISEHIEEKPGRIGIGGGGSQYSNSMHIRRIAFTPDGVHVDATPTDGKPLLIEVSPPLLELVAVTNRGTSYHPPCDNESGRSLTPEETAEIGIEHARGALQCVEAS